MLSLSKEGSMMDMIYPHYEFLKPIDSIGWAALVALNSIEKTHSS
jgi:hypothetical protein